MSVPSHQHVLERIRAEFLEMPGMRLRVEQVQRLCAVERHVCEAALNALVDARFLRLVAGGMYVRATNDLQVRLRSAKFQLRAARGELAPRTRTG
jgi:hypothetical protein